MALDFPNSSIEQTYIAPNGVTYVWNGTSWVVTPVLPVSRGGTGFTTYAHGDILYGNSSGTLSKLNPSTSGYVLSTNGSGADPSWIAMSAGGGAGTIATGAQYQIAGYYSGAGASASGSTTFTNDTNNAIVNIGHTTASTNSTTGALVVAGGVGVAKTSYFGQDIFVTGNMNVSGTAITLFSSVSSNYLTMNTGSSGVLRIQTEVNNSRVRMFENMTTGTLGFFGTSGGTLYLGTDSGTANGNITIRGNNTTGGGGNQRAAIFTLATATSNGIGTGGTIVFQTSTSSSVPGVLSNILRTRFRIEGAATGTSNYESIIVLGDTNSGTAWTSYIRGVDATGFDVDAGEIQIQAGRSTGTGNAQGISFYVSQSAIATTTFINTANQIARLSATGLTINSTTASVSATTGSLIVAGGAGIGGSLNVADVSKFFQHLEIKTQKELRFYNSSDSNYVALKAGTLSASTTYTLPTAAPGSGSSFLTSDTSGVLTWAPVTSSVSAINAGAGISIPSSTGSVTVSIGRPVVLNLASGFTPVGIGTDYNILRVPEGKSNINTNYIIKKVIMGVGSTSLGTSTIRLEKSAGPHTGLVGFSNSSTASTFNVMTSDLSLIGAIGETSWVDFKSGYGTAATGDRIRVNYTAVDATHANFIIQCLLEEY